ncbi:hypothetical protein KY363_02380 [Candidatus Woesearchaeota archaeon]|nr:hypothetical protein [Candidatus Woesearchaeota archaeon]
MGVTYRIIGLLRPKRKQNEKVEQNLRNLEVLVKRVTGLADMKGVVHRARTVPLGSRDDGVESYLLFILDREKQKKFVMFILKKLEIDDVFGLKQPAARWLKIRPDYSVMHKHYVVKLRSSGREFFMAPEFSEGALWIDGQLAEAVCRQ